MKENNFELNFYRLPSIVDMILSLELPPGLGDSKLQDIPVDIVEWENDRCHVSNQNHDQEHLCNGDTL